MSTDFKLGELSRCEEQHVTRSLFNFSMSNRPQIEICQIFDLYSE